MKVVYVATFSHSNYGSALQAVSLHYALKEIGAQPKFLEAYSKDLRGIKKYIKAFKVYFWPEKHYGLYKKARRYFERYKYVEKNEKIKSFCNANIEYHIIDLDTYSPELDSNECVYLAGSDQIWNIIDRDIHPLYTFGFINEDNYRFYSYAASIGLDHLSNHQIEYYEKALKRFSVVSFREKSAVDLFKKSSLSCILRQDLDPTLLHDSTFWNKFVTDKPILDGYIFVYMLRPDKRLINMAVELAKRENLKIVYSGLYAYRDKHMITDNTAGPCEFISYIKNANYVITNSFHGTCFSTIYHKKFVSVSIDSTGSRAKDYLYLINLENHLISSKLEIDVIFEDINYKAVDEKLKKLRSQSYAYLKEITR